MNLYYYYDQEADVLYFSKGRPSPRDRSEEAEDDVVLRFDACTGAVRGFTIPNFIKRLKHKQAAVALPLRAELELAPA